MTPPRETIVTTGQLEDSDVSTPAVLQDAFGDTDTRTRDDAAYSAEEEARVEERLKNLGYL